MGALPWQAQSLEHRGDGHVMENGPWYPSPQHCGVGCGGQLTGSGGISTPPMAEQVPGTGITE